VDNDGYLDVVLTGYHRCALLRNLRGVRLQDVTGRSGIRQSGWASSAAFGDYDGDGLLDLYIGNYVVFGPDSPQHCRFGNGAVGGCPPQVYPPERGVLLHNNGDGTFADATRAAGLDRSSGKTLAVSWCDFDDDGDPDLYLANDGVPGNLFRNDGGGHFRDIGVESGTAFGVNHLAQAGMGVDWADYNRDGFLDLVVTAFSSESFSLYRYDGMLFDNVSAEAGLASPTYYPLGFGCHFLDVDLDGWPDLAFADGHVYDQAAKIHTESPFRQRPQVLRNDGGRFTDVSSEAGAAFQQAVVGRGLAVGDFDNDGRPDLLMALLDGPPLLLRNVTQPAGAAIRLTLHADGRHGNLFAYGARVSVDSAGGRRAASVSPGASYLSSSDPRVYMGALPGELPTGVTVHWPDGRRESFPPPAPDRETELREGHGAGAANGIQKRSGE
jgi:hypothetical protein